MKYKVEFEVSTDIKYSSIEECIEDFWDLFIANGRLTVLENKIRLLIDIKKNLVPPVMQKAANEAYKNQENTYNSVKNFSVSPLEEEEDNK